MRNVSSNEGTNDEEIEQDKYCSGEGDICGIK
jgi:hypothetical protein